MIVSCSLAVAKLRPGVADLFKLYDRFNIPTIILSVGVKEVIEAMDQYSGISASQLVATKLLYTSDGTITGWDKKHWSMPTIK